jgi:hypothetical protein
MKLRHRDKVNSIIIAGLMTCLAFMCIILVELNGYAPEYGVELVDQETVEISSYSTGKVYTTTYDSITYYLEIDNL